MNPLGTPLSDIAHILSFNSEDTISLEQDISNENLDWEAIVKLGSKHLIIPTIYSRLKSKKLLKLLPEDLQEYLKYIYSLNKERNESLLNEVKHINSWFIKQNIEHVFLKGAAMIASNYYEDSGERMLGDIDLLVPKEQSEKAFQILVDKGYTYAKEPTINPKYFEDKHLLRLASKDYIGAVEVHFKVLDKDQEDLHPKDVLKDKTFINITGIPIPHPKHLLIHNILNFQINDSGSYYNYIGLKNCYDSIVLLPHLNPKERNELFNNPHILNNLNLGSLYFKDIPEPPHSIRAAYYRSIYSLKNRYKAFNSIHYKTLAYLDFSKLLLHRSWFFIINKNYRADVLNDRERIKEFIKSKL
ncbi:conserved hypothetical protein [Formosa agariphila KMM 3901]|uniref:Uncharacterized protein n=1 Tax=Formosa agariphila (strain DSM 15362 / KCTC 12365 / LMG 23005 / KMM 3901 / M-2Alg 35-1) TaxID=1347342 RepID=T2KPH7_FORAG|nr:nucleotidyltransferase family protein [Formosa agariphila]CDF80655.1 conserved hypothetical protein [Formosa agariphila KMM 3901]